MQMLVTRLGFYVLEKKAEKAKDAEIIEKTTDPKVSPSELLIKVVNILSPHSLQLTLDINANHVFTALLAVFSTDE